MFRSLSGERLLSGGQSSSSPTGQAVTSPGLDSQENSWIALLSRPAMFLQRYLSGRPRSPAMSDSGAGWLSRDLKTSFVDEEREFLRQLDDIDPVPHLTYLRCQHDAAAGLLEPGGGGASSWLSVDSLREIGIQSAEEMDLNLCQQTQIGYFSSARTFLSHVLLSSVTSQEIKPPGEGKDWVRTGESKSKTWWGSFWGGEESSPPGLRSDVSWAEEGAATGQLCPQRLAAEETKAPSAQTTDVFVRSGGEGWTLGENTGPTDHKEEPANNGGLQTVQNTEGSTSDPRLSISNHLSGPGAAAACSEVALLTPDQDNGYSSLEEEHFQMCRQYTAPSGEQQQAGSAETGAPVGTEMEEETREEGESTSGKVDEGEETLEEEEDQEEGAQEGESAEEAVVTSPQCQNKAIAFIMGCPCSDDDSSQSEGESSDDEDDDGFDSEGSSDLTDSTDEDDEDDDEASDSDSEADSEADRLWTSLCQSADPYNPQNFTARLHTSSTPPRTIPTSTPPSSTQSSPASSPDLTPLPLSASSPPSGSDAWDDSTSASEVDEAESLRLWSSFSSSADPYSPFNFQAPLRTRVSGEAAPRTRARAKKASSCSPHHNPASPPEYRKDGAEERLDSGFSEPSTSSSTSSSQSCSTTKKVRFCDQVEEFFASCGEEDEDRRGPWEELARDRCRFLRRCQDVELSIAYCLQPQHRSLVYHRLTVLYVQDT